MAAEVACRAATEEGIVTAIVPARTAVQGLAALAVVDLGKGLRENAIAMTSAAVATRHGAVSVASREVLTWAGPRHARRRPGHRQRRRRPHRRRPGDRRPRGARPAPLRRRRARHPASSGADADDALVDAVADRLAKEHAEVEVVRLDGGQQVYPLLVGVE